MLYLIAYDLTDDQVRTRIAKTLLATGLERIQYSVFTGPLNEVELERLKVQIRGLLNGQAEYSLLCIPLHADMLAYVYHFGSKPLDWEYLSGNAHTLII